ncbi:hypothetical protein HMPREF3036_02539 [Sutterella sp. KLE1602]|nr:hypothetical protein HMPREF3036_02539 [Sutterella sp. KLE1602]
MKERRSIVDVLVLQVRVGMLKVWVELFFRGAVRSSADLKMKFCFRSKFC